MDIALGSELTPQQRETANERRLIEWQAHAELAGHARFAAQRAKAALPPHPAACERDRKICALLNEGPRLDQDVLEVAVLPGGGRVRDHDERGVVELVVLHVQEHQLRPVVVLLAHLQGRTTQRSFFSFWESIFRSWATVT